MTQRNAPGIAPKIALVLPRNTRFGPARATSVDLCAHDLARHGRHAATTRVFCDEVDAPYDDVAITQIRYDKAHGNAARMRALVAALKAAPADLIVVHQHLPTAARLRRLFAAPVLLHTHNFLKLPSNLFGRLQRRRDYGRLSGLIFVSETCRRAFEADYPANAAPKAVVENGLDMRDWRADRPRRENILVVGRAMPEKGMIEAMRALAATLPAFPTWRASFILSESEKHGDYFAALSALAGASEGRIAILEKLPYAQVQALHVEASIAIVLSKWREPFGRTALEAHAAGAALISSGSGGLKEISGEHALYVDPDDPGGLEAALAALMRDPILRARLARDARARVEALFDVRTLAAKLDDFYDTALKQKGRGV